MRIGINALYLLPGRVGGSETYIRNLVKHLSILGGHEYFLFINRESSGVFDHSMPNVRIVECPVNAAKRHWRILKEQWWLPRMARKLKLDVLFSAGMTAPFCSSVPSAVMIFDLQHVNQPQNFSLGYLLFLRAIIYLGAKRAKRVLTISNKVKDDLISHYNIPPERIGITYLAASSAYSPVKAGQDEPLRDRLKLPRRFVLYAASSLPHKNYKRLLSAFKDVRERMSDVSLVLTGARDYGFEAIEAEIQRLGLSDAVRFLGWLPFEDVPALYRLSELFVYPSLHEGFGLPLLEAMGSGVPVVCSNIEPLSEIAGSSALFVDPYDARDIAKGMLSILEDGALRKRFVRDGFARAREFSWEATAKGTIKELEATLRAGR